MPLAVLTVLAMPLVAQGVIGAWTMAGQKGAISLILKGTGVSVTGSLSGAGMTYQIRGQIDASGTFIGEALGAGVRSYLEAMAKGDQLAVVMAELGPDGTPLTATARQLAFTRSGGGLGGGIIGGLIGGRASGKVDSDPFVGRFSNEQATVVMAREAAGYRGSFQRAGQQVPMQARAAGKGLSGTIQDTNGTSYLFLLHPDPKGVELEINGMKFLLVREQGDSVAPGQGTAAMAGATPVGGAGSIGRGTENQQLAQLLISGRWCHSSYKVTGGSGSGRSYQETVAFSRDGIMTVSRGGENYSSGAGGTFASQNQGGPQRLFWRIQGGLLQISTDGATWAPLPMKVTTNSNGWPIITGDGKEYTRCN
jgi:hypothetical protein